jgi:nitrogen fixation protein FixH
MTSETTALHLTVGRRQRGAWIPWAFVAALAIVVAVNVALTYFALHSAPGTVSDHPYEDGLDYDRVLARAAAQDALGWRSDVALAPGAIEIRLVDRTGAPLAGAAVAVRLARPVGPADPVGLTLAEVAPGRYAGAVEPRPGQWDLHLVARRGEDSFAAVHRVIVK